MDIHVSYDKEKGFNFSATRPDDMSDEDYFSLLSAEVGYASLVVAMMRGECKRPTVKMMLEYISNTTRQMFDDDTVFEAVKEGIKANEKRVD